MPSLLEHEGCGGKLQTPKIFYKDGDKTKSENCDDYRFCLKCRKMIEIQVRQK